MGEGAKMSKGLVGYLRGLDQLTGVNTERVFKRRYKKEGGEGYFINLDLANFRYINEFHTREVGDSVLRFVGDELNSFLLAGEYAGRVRDDIFVIYARGPEKQLATRLQRLRVNLSVFKQKVRLDLQLCMAVYKLSEGIDRSYEKVWGYTNFLKRGVKGEHYTGGILFCHSDKYRCLMDTYTLSQNIREGLFLEQFKPYFQPLIDAKTGELYGAEVLVRWELARGRVLMPGSFLPAIAETSLLEMLDKYIVTKALSIVRSWELKGDSFLLSVNLDGYTLLSDTLIDFLDRQCQIYGINPSMLEIEILENVFYGDKLPYLERRVKELKALGFKVALDDFGTGYAVYDLLRQIPLDVLKIDRQLLSGVLEDKKAYNVYKSVVELGKGLGLKLVAEGVETAPQLEFLKKMGVDITQGFYYEKALSGSQFQKTYVDIAR